MGSVYLRGQPVAIVKRFSDVDPLTGVGVPENPDVVTFTVRDPDDGSTDYVFGVDTEVTNPAVGVFLLSLPPLEPFGAWKWRCAGTGSGLVDAEEGAFDVIESGVLDPDDRPSVAVTGPCSGWINADDVLSMCGDGLNVGSDTWLLDDVAYMASSLLYDLSGRQFPGVCERTVRPCQQGCGCWNNSIIPIGVSWYWGAVGGWWGGGWGVGPYWVNDYGGTCGCTATSFVRLAGYPVQRILEVLIDGVALPEFDVVTGARNWRLDNRTDLTRMWMPGGGDPTPQQWPGCQNLSLDDDQPGTFSVRYLWGADTPPLGRRAAAQLARELFLACSGAKCLLPTKVTKVVRQGITIERVVPIAEMLRQGSTGIQLVDAFIAQYNPGKMIRRPAVFTPDDQQYAPKLGQG